MFFLENIFLNKKYLRPLSFKWHLETFVALAEAELSQLLYRPFFDGYCWQYCWLYCLQYCQQHCWISNIARYPWVTKLQRKFSCTLTVVAQPPWVLKSLNFRFFCLKKNGAGGFNCRVSKDHSFKVSKFPSYQVSKFPSFQVAKWEGGSKEEMGGRGEVRTTNERSGNWTCDLRTNERLWIKLHPMAQKDKQTDMAALWLNRPGRPDSVKILNLIDQQLCYKMHSIFWDFFVIPSLVWVICDWMGLPNTWQYVSIVWHNRKPQETYQYVNVC